MDSYYVFGSLAFSLLHFKIHLTGYLFWLLYTIFLYDYSTMYYLISSLDVQLSYFIVVFSTITSYTNVSIFAPVSCIKSLSEMFISLDNMSVSGWKKHVFLICWVSCSV